MVSSSCRRPWARLNDATRRTAPLPKDCARIDSISRAGSGSDHQVNRKPRRARRSTSGSRDVAKIRVAPGRRATCRSGTTASLVDGPSERAERSAKSSTTAKPPQDLARNSDAVVRALKDAWRAGRTAANPGPRAAVAGAVRPKISVARPREDSSCAVRSAYLGRISSKTTASAVGSIPGFIGLFDGRGAIGNGSAWTATRAKHASAMGDARFAPASDASPRNSSSYAYTGPATIRAMTPTPSQNECAASNLEEYRA